MRTRYLRVLAIVVGSLVAIAVLGAEGTGLTEVTGADLQDIIGAIMQRQSKVKTVKCTWTSQTMYPKGSLEVQTPQGFSTGKFPTEDTVVENVITVLIDGQKIRNDKKGLVWSAGEAQFVPGEECFSFVKSAGRSFFKTINHGRITRECDTALNITYAPVCFAYRLFDPVLGTAKPSEFRLVGRAEHEGHPCIVIEKGNDLKPGQIGTNWERWWLAQDKDYSLVQWQLLNRDETPRFQTSMQYEQDEQVGWRLESWEVLTLRQGKVSSSTSNVVTETRLNEPIQGDAFEISFPAGTRVWDNILEVEYVTSGGPKIEVE